MKRKMIKTIKRLKKAHLNKLYSYFVDGYSWLDIFMICTLAFEGGWDTNYQCLDIGWNWDVYTCVKIKNAHFKGVD